MEQYLEDDKRKRKVLKKVIMKAKEKQWKDYTELDGNLWEKKIITYRPLGQLVYQILWKNCIKSLQ